MNEQCKRLKQFLVSGKHVHLVGIGGVSMRPLGLVLKDKGILVSGSDMNASVSTDELISKGIPVAIGHAAENIFGADCVIRTAAAHNDNPEIAAARAAGIPVFERAQAWGVIMQDYKNAICIAGTHGKTTTTSMLAHILLEAKQDPTVMIGGELPLLHSGHRVGQGDSIILESCEYCDSFLNFLPTLAVILNVEADHLDYFKDLADVQKSFRKFAQLATAGVIANGDDIHTTQALEGLSCLSFGLEPHNRIRGVNICEQWRKFDVICDGEFYCHIDLQVLGRHNMMNAIAAAGAAWFLGIPGDAVTSSLLQFHGARRRLEFKGTYHGADVFDDYAHHPDELAATLDAVKTMNYKRVIVAFQPHTYTRTKALYPDFIRELQKPDLVILTEIYAARERNTIGISSENMVDEIPGSVFAQSLPDVARELVKLAQPGDVILTIGAGDIYRAGEMILRNLE